MQAYAAALVATTLHGSRDVNGARNGWDKPPKGRSAAVAERCALTTREHGSHPAAFVGELGVADGVDPLMNAVQTAHPGAVSNPIRIEPATLTRHFNALLRNAHLRPIRFHDLRHSTATLLLEQGVELVVIKELLSHRSSAHL